MDFLARVVFAGRACGEVFRYSPGCTPVDGSIILADALTNDVALVSVRTNASGIVTRTGSFATHGANLIRSACSGSRACPVWATDVQDADGKLREIAGTVHMTAGGANLHIGCDESIDRESGPGLDCYRPSSAREIVMMHSREERLWRVYWPHRRYDILTASLMIPGLQDCCSLLTKRSCEIKRSREGLLLFDRAAPDTASLCRIAVDVRRSSGFLEIQTEAYEDLLRQLQVRATQPPLPYFEWLVQAIRKYFSVLLLLHNTYEYVFYRLAQQLATQLDATSVARAMDASMQSGLNRWQVEESVVLQKWKDVLSDDRLAPLPHFSVREDFDITLAATLDGVRGIFSGVRISPAANLYPLLRHACWVFVLKEWKFVLNKILFSRFALCAKQISACADADSAMGNIEHWRGVTVDEVLKYGRDCQSEIH